MYNIDVLNVPTNKIGFSNHPVFKYYNQSMEYRAFLYYCLMSTCNEYYFRFSKYHNSIFVIEGIEKLNVEGFLPDVNDLRKLNDCIKQVKPAYIKGNIVDNSIFYTTKYQELLTSKWFTEIDNGTKPKRKDETYEKV